MRDLQAILGGTFRANPAYELVLYDRLAPAERELLAGLAREPGFYGVLRPRGGAAALGSRSVDRETALLLLTLAEPAPLPGYVRGMFGEGRGDEEAARTVARLVADGVLEVATGEGFASGAAALPLFAGPEPGEGGALAALSRDALRYAQELPTGEPLRLSAALYGYNRRPLTPRWRCLLPDAAALPRVLGTGSAAFARRWEALPPAPGWISWRARGASRLERGPEGGATYKLYVSPLPEAIATEAGGGCFPALAEALAAARVMQWKVGADAAGLLRPDKVVAYFPRFEALARAAETLSGALAGLPAHGVPFTAEIAGGGLLSWGVDPPRGEGLPWSGGMESWRLWLTHRLARALLSARAESSPVEPWRFARERLRLEGVDPATWAPAATIFRES